MFVVPKNKGKGLLRYRTLNNSDVEQLEKNKKEQTSNRGRVHRGVKENTNETSGSSETKKKSVTQNSVEKTKNTPRDSSNSEDYDLDIECLEKLLDEDDEIVTPITWKIVDMFFSFLVVLLKIGILITLICISCDKDGKGCLACSTCKNEDINMELLSQEGSIFENN